MSRFTGVGRRRTGARRLRPLRLLSLCVALAGVWALASMGMAQAQTATPAQASGAAAQLRAMTTPTLSTGPGTGATPAQQAVQLDSPAVTRIVSVVNASLVCAACASDGSDIHSPADGSTFTYYSSGSGAFISADGAILTADHVVDHSMNNAEDVSFIEQQAAQDIATKYNVTTDQALTYLQGHPSKVTITFSVVFQKAFLSTAYTGNLPDTSHVYAFNIASVAASSPVNKQDTAIVRIDTSGISPAPDFPYLTLSSAPVNALDNVTAIAYPADADLALNNADFTALADVKSSDVNTINSLLSPSVNTGTITKANEIRPDGTQVYEASSIASNGSSGGPVINNQGQVIGFVDAGPATDRLTFIIPSAVVAPYAAQAGIGSKAPGRFMTLWTRALTEYNSATSCHWTNAATDLTTLKTQYPTFGGVSPYLAQAKQQASKETCATGGASSTTITGDVTAGFTLIIGCLVATIALVLGVIFLVVALGRRKKRPQVAAAPYASQYPPMQTPYPPAGYPSSSAVQSSLPYPPGVRFCPNGHAVAEADATYCPICGAPMRPGPARG